MLPWLGSLASSDNRLRPSFHYCFVTNFDILGTIAAYADDDVIGMNLIEQAWQFRLIAGVVVSHFYSQISGVAASILPISWRVMRRLKSLRRWPCATSDGSPPNAFWSSTHRRPASWCPCCRPGVQSRYCGLGGYRQRKMLLASVNGAEVGYLPV
jgi:hypothetical protein